MVKLGILFINFSKKIKFWVTPNCNKKPRIWDNWNNQKLKLNLIIKKKKKNLIIINAFQYSLTRPIIIRLLWLLLWLKELYGFCMYIISTHHHLMF